MTADPQALARTDVISRLRAEMKGRFPEAVPHRLSDSRSSFPLSANERGPGNGERRAGNGRRRAGNGDLGGLLALLAPGAIAAIAGASSSGKTAIAVAALAAIQAASPASLAAWIDLPAAFFPPGAARAGVDLDRTLVARPEGLDGAVAAADVLLRCGAFALVVLDAAGRAGDIPGSAAARLAVMAQRSRTALLVIAEAERADAPLPRGGDAGEDGAFLAARPARGARGTDPPGGQAQAGRGRRESPIRAAAALVLAVERAGIGWEGPRLAAAGLRTLRVRVEVERARGTRPGSTVEVALDARGDARGPEPVRSADGTGPGRREGVGARRARARSPVVREPDSGAGSFGLRRPDAAGALLRAGRPRRDRGNEASLDAKGIGAPAPSPSSAGPSLGRRVACLWIPEPRVQLELRAGLPGRAFAVLAGDASGGRGTPPSTPRELARRPVVAVSPEAAAAGIRVGMTRAQARAVCPEVAPIVADEARYQAGFEAVIEALRGLSPVVEAGGLGTAYLDATGIVPLFGSEAAFAGAAIVAARDAAGLEGRVGIASNRFVARTAAAFGSSPPAPSEPDPEGRASPGALRLAPSRGARSGRAEADRARIVDPGDEARFLAPLPIEALPAAPEELEALAMVGLRRLGEVAAIPPEALAERLGERGPLLARLCRGVDPTPLEPARPAAIEAIEVAFDPPAEALPGPGPLDGLLDALHDRLSRRGLACRRLRLTLAFETAPAADVDIGAAEATADRETLAVLLRERLAGLALPDRLSGLRLEAAETAPAREQEPGLFDGAERRTEPLARTLARLALVLARRAPGARRPARRPPAPDEGSARVAGTRPLAGAFELLPAPLPERAFRLVPFRPARRAGPGPTAAGEGPRRAGPAPPALRLLAPPAAVAVETDAEGRPVALRLGLAGRRRRIVGRTGPLRVELPGIARDAHVVELADGSVLHLARDSGTKGDPSWSIVGVLD